MKTTLGFRIPPKVARAGIFLLMLALVAGMVSCPVCPAPEPSVYSVEDWYGLDLIRNDMRGIYVLTGHLHSDTDGYDQLVSATANGGKGWVPIVGFKGTFDGQGKEIRDLFINRPEEENVGLFGYVDKGIVKNVHVVNADVTGGKRVGSLVGFNWGTVTTDSGYTPTSSSGTVRASGEGAGGLVGRNNYILTHSESSATVQGEISVGGLVGVNHALTSVVSSSSASGTVSGHEGVGGLVGINHYRVVDSSASGQVWGSRGVGGLVGRNFGRVTHSNSNGNVNGNSGVPAMVKYSLDGSVSNPLAVVLPGDSDIGGLVGHNGAEAVVSECYSTGSVTGTSNVGGLVGLNEGAVEDCHSSGTVTGESAVGRLVGHNTQTGIVSKSVSTSCVTGTLDCGDLVGVNEGNILPVEERAVEVITLSFITFWPSGDFQAAIGHKAYMDTIAARVLAETTDYEIKWDVFYAGTEMAADIYKVVRDGVYDIGATGPGYSPGVFPLFEAMNLPGGLRRTNSYTMSLTKQALYDQYPPLQAEMAKENLHLCHLWSVGPGYFLMMPGKSVRTLADFPGKSFRSATLGSDWAITAVGGTPIRMSMDEAKEQFGAGLLDGILCPTDTPKGFGLGEYVREVTFAPFSYDFVFMKIMNKAKYNGLPAKVKTIFDDVNAKWSGYYGQLRTWGEADGLEYMKPLPGYSYYDVTTEAPAEYASWVALMAPVVSDWIAGDATKQALWNKYVELDLYYATTPPYSTWTPGATPPPAP